MYKKNTVDGSLTFDEKAIKSVVGIAASSCYGVVSMASTNRVRDYLFNTVNKEYHAQGIVIRSESKNIVDLDVHVVLGYSIPVKNVCVEIKKRVAYEVERNLNIRVRDINVYVEAIDKIR